MQASERARSEKKMESCEIRALLIHEVVDLLGDGSYLEDRAGWGRFRRALREPPSVTLTGSPVVRSSIQ